MRLNIVILNISVDFYSLKLLLQVLLFAQGQIEQQRGGGESARFVVGGVLQRAGAVAGGAGRPPLQVGGHHGAGKDQLVRLLGLHRRRLAAHPPALVSTWGPPE